MIIAPPILTPRRPSSFHPHDKGRIAGDLHMAGYRDGERSGATFDRIFGILLAADADATRVGEEVAMNVAGDAIALHVMLNRDTVEGITVHDAPVGIAFRRLLFALLSAGPYVLVRTPLTPALEGGERVVHAGTVTESDVPPEIIDGLGPLTRVANAEGLADFLA